MTARAVRPLGRAAVVLTLLTVVAAGQALLDPYRRQVNDEANVPFPLAAVVVRSVLGDVRNLVADFLWLRVDEYQHRRRIVGGDLDRGDDEALMPLLRLITWSNPHFVDAYALGGQWLAFHFNEPRQAVAFYEEGIRNNPKNVDLLTGAAWVYWRLHESRLATARARDAAAVAPDDLHRFQALWFAAHVLADAGDKAGAIRTWREVGKIPGYESTARTYISRLSGPQGGDRPR